MAEVAAVVLAAGAGTRFGEQPKLLAELHGRPILEHALRNVRAVPALGRTVVVLGAHADAIRARVDFAGTEPVECPDWAEGQAASLRCGLAAVEDAQKVLVLLGDEPLVTPQVIARFADEEPGARAAFDGRPGHPVVLGPKLMRAARSLTGDRGLRDVARWRLVECGHLAQSDDVDTPQDLAALQSRAGGR